MNRVKNVLWGIVLVVLGVIFGLNALGITEIDLFFSGWWTLFIIVPCAVGVFSSSEKGGNLIGLVFGIVLLLACQGFFRFEVLWKLLVPVIIVLIGLRLIFKDVFNRKAMQIIDKIGKKGSCEKEFCATFSGQNLNFAGERFESAELTAVFGGIKCDLRDAVLANDAVLNISAIFGGVTVYVPDDVNVKIISNSIFGGISDERKFRKNDNAVTLYINGSCIFGGADIK